MVKNLPASAEGTVSIPGLERSLEKAMATHSSVLPEKFHGHGVAKSRNLLGPNCTGAGN